MYIFTYLKLISIFLFNLITNNPFKVLLIILALVSWNFAGTFDNSKYEAEIVKEVVIDNNYLYLEERIIDNKISYKIHQYDKPQELKDNKIKWEEYSVYNILCWIIFIISFLSLLVPTLVGWFEDDDDGIGWCVSNSWGYASRSIIHCIEEDGIFYYMALGRLIGKRDSQIRRNNIRYVFGINSLADILFCPKYQTKSQKRENNLSKIGIN